MDIADLYDGNDNPKTISCAGRNCQNYFSEGEGWGKDDRFCIDCGKIIEHEKMIDEMDYNYGEEEIHLKLQDEYDGTVNEDDDRSDIQKMNDDAKRMGWSE